MKTFIKSLPLFIIFAFNTVSLFSQKTADYDAAEIDAYIDAAVLKIVSQRTPQIVKYDWLYFDKGEEISFNKVQYKINISWQSNFFEKKVYWMYGNLIIDIKGRCCSVEFNQLDYSSSIEDHAGQKFDCITKNETEGMGTGKPLKRKHN